MIPVGKSGSRKLTPRLLGEQNHRCACCGMKLSLSVVYDDVSRPSVVKWDRARHRSYENCVICCRRCSGRQANYPSLIAYWDAVQEGRAELAERPKPPVSDEVYDAIMEQLRERGIVDLAVPRDFARAPMDAVPNIVTMLAARYHLHSPAAKAARLKRKQDKTAKWQSFDQRIRFMEAQGHRCCYCHVEFETSTTDSTHPSYPTWEHVVDLSSGGMTQMQNIVIACSLCNNTRSLMGLSAVAFYEWAQANQSTIEDARRARLKRAASRLLQRGHVMISRREKPFFDYG